MIHITHCTLHTLLNIDDHLVKVPLHFQLLSLVGVKVVVAVQNNVLLSHLKDIFHGKMLSEDYVWTLWRGDFILEIY